MPYFYNRQCAQRYKAVRRRYQQQFQNEAKAMVSLQPSALEAVRLERAFQEVTVWPDDKFLLKSPHLTKFQARRVEKIVTEPRIVWP